MRKNAAKKRKGRKIGFVFLCLLRILAAIIPIRQAMQSHCVAASRGDRWLDSIRIKVNKAK
jgi:hypothetical protein